MTVGERGELIGDQREDGKAKLFIIQVTVSAMLYSCGELRVTERAMGYLENETIIR